MTLSWSEALRNRTPLDIGYHNDDTDISGTYHQACA
jgi:hypothetical protein